MQLPRPSTLKQTSLPKARMIQFFDRLSPLPEQRRRNMRSSQTSPGFRTREALGFIASDVGKRTLKLVSGSLTHLFTLLHLIHYIPSTDAGYLSLNDANPNYGDFVAGPESEPTPNQTALVQADINNFISTSMFYSSWVARAKAIRSSGRRDECVGNLSVALNVGAAYQAGMSSSNTLLSLIPTAGILIGAPAKELWVL